MIIQLTEEALAFGRVAQDALGAAGGDRLVELAERDPSGHRAQAEPALAEIGAWDLDARGSTDELEAAAVLCRATGWWGIPYPVAERLARPSDLDVDALVVVGPTPPAAAVDGLDLRLVAVGLDGRRYGATPLPSLLGPRKSAFVTGLDLSPVGDGTTADIAIGLVLPCWTLLGMLDRALALAIEHVQQRVQFGQPLAALQSVQFQLTDAEVERAGVEELAKYALWSIETDRPDAIEDALALRLAALDGAATVFRICHQLHGASGFCDEAPISWISRYSQAIRRLPLGLSATRAELTRRIGRHGLAGIYGHGVGAQ